MWSGTNFEIELTLLRHGQTKGNLEHRYIGRTEEPLCREGREALKKCREALKRQKISTGVLFVSPMVRCAQSAGILFPGMEMVEIPEWREMDFGRFEGKNYLELKEDTEYQRWIDSNGSLPFPEGESREAFVERVKKGYNRMIRDLEEKPAALSSVSLPRNPAEAPEKLSAAAVVHGGTIMALLSSFCGGDYFDYQVKNGEGYQCHIHRQNNIENWKVKKL